MLRAVRFRMPAALTLGLAVLLFQGAAAPATQPATEPALPADDLALLHQLESGTWHQRKAAEGQIANWDVTQIPVVRAMLARTANPEAQARLQGALAQLQGRAETKTSLITLHEKDAAAKEVYRELFGQAFAPLKTEPANLLDALPPLTADADHQPFWSVLQQLQKKTGVGFSRDIAGACALCRLPPIPPGPQVISGPFLIIAAGTQLFPLPPMGPGDRDFLLHLQLYSEPKILLWQIMPTVKLDKMVDDRGNVLEQEPIMFGEQNSVFGQPLILVGLRFPGQNRGKHLVTVRGTMKGMISQRSVGFDIANPVGAPTQSVDLGGVSLIFVGCKKVGDGYRVDFATSPDPKKLMSLAMQQGSTMHLLDAQGNELFTNNMKGSINPVTGDTLKYLYESPPGSGIRLNEPKRLVWKVPADFRWVDIPFDFENVSIPIGNK